MRDFKPDGKKVVFTKKVKENRKKHLSLLTLRTPLYVHTKEKKVR